MGDNLVYRSKNGVRFNVFVITIFAYWTIPKDFIECRESTMLEF